MWHGDWLFRHPLVPKHQTFMHKTMLKWVPECLSPASLKMAKLLLCLFYPEAGRADILLQSKPAGGDKTGCEHVEQHLAGFFFR